MFAGTGGFREGLTRAGGFTCVGHCECDKYAERSYRALFDWKESGTQKMPEKPTPTPCPASTCSAADFLARLQLCWQTPGLRRPPRHPLL